MIKFGLIGNFTVDGSWSLSSSGPANTIAPNPTDDAKLDINSGDITLVTTSLCRSLDCTGYLHHLIGTGQSLLIGDAISGSGNIALRLVSSMTIDTLVFFFESSSGTFQTVDFAGKTVSDVVFEQPGKWLFIGTFISNSRLTLTRGSLDLNGQTFTMANFRSSNTNIRKLFGAGTITLNGSGANWECPTATNLDLTGFIANIIMSGSNANFQGGVGKSYGGNLTLSGSGTAVFDSGIILGDIVRTGGNLTINNDLLGKTFTCTGEAAARTITIAADKKLTVEGLTINGSSGKVLSFVSGTPGTPAYIYIPTGMIVTCDYMSFTDIIVLGGGVIDAGMHSTDGGGNQGINFAKTAVVTSAKVTRPSRDKVTANGQVVSDGGDTILERGFVYGTTSNPTLVDTKVIVTGTTGSYSTEITGLSLGVKYYYRAYATNGSGTTYGGNQSFKARQSFLSLLGVS